MRIRGQIGEWPVDISIELTPEEWAHMGRAAAPVDTSTPANTPVVSVVSPRPDDQQWEAACSLLREAGSLSGPLLLERLDTLCGSPGTGKRLLVRLRHSAQVRVDNGKDAPVYHWLG